MAEATHLYEFGPFQLDARQQLRPRAGEVVPLTPKALELLLVLVRSGSRLLTKEELLQRVWPDSFVKEANLSHNIYKLREHSAKNRMAKSISRLCLGVVTLSSLK